MNNEEKDKGTSFNKYHSILKELVYQCRINFLKSPLEIYFELTNSCNLQCVYCYKQSTLIQEEKEEIPIEKILETIEQLQNEEYLLVLEGGEPFLYSQIFELLKECKNRKIRVDILTNGTLLNEENIVLLQEVYDVDLFEIQISIDGVNDFNRLNRTSDGAKVFKAIKLLNQIGIRPRIQTVITINNYQGVCSLLKILNEESDIRSLTMCSVFGKKNDNLKLSITEINNLKQDIATIKNELHFPVYDFTEYTSDQCMNTYLERNEGKFVKCTAMRSKVCINHRCDVYPCVFFENHMQPIGNIKVDSLIDIWNSDKANMFREKILHKAEKCSRCEHARKCPQICMARER